MNQAVLIFLLSHNSNNFLSYSKYIVVNIVCVHAFFSNMSNRHFANPINFLEKPNIVCHLPGKHIGCCGYCLLYC